MHTSPHLQDLIVPLVIDGMQGRMLRVPAADTGKQQILLVYGHHASLERIYGMAEDLSQYGTVTAPDLPGFGGMDTFYKIGKKPTLDNLADYLAACIAQAYPPDQKLTIAAMSFGFAVVTRMLQRHPRLQLRVTLLVSMVGLVHGHDFKFKPRTVSHMRLVAKFCSALPVAWFVRYVLLQRPFIRLAYLLVADKHVKLRDADAAERNRRIDFEVTLWQINDVRTYMQTGLAMLNLDLLEPTIALPVHHTAVKHDRYFDNAAVERDMRQLFSEVHMIYSAMEEGHAPTVIADAEASAELIPQSLRDVLARKAYYEKIIPPHSDQYNCGCSELPASSRN